MNGVIARIHIPSTLSVVVVAAAGCMDTGQLCPSAKCARPSHCTNVARPSDRLYIVFDAWSCIFFARDLAKPYRMCIVPEVRHSFVTGGYFMWPARVCARVCVAGSSCRAFNL
jgi:hypothetical protein